MILSTIRTKMGSFVITAIIGGPFFLWMLIKKR